jgi:DNA-binding response OmpR family regulator
VEARKPTRTVPALGKLALKKVAAPSSRSAPAPGRAAPAALGPVRRAVVAEADKAVREAVVASLPKDRFEVYAFSDGDSAYEHITLQGADVVVLGKDMPGIQGTVLSDLLRKGKSGPALAIVLMSPRYNGPGVGPGDCAAFGADQFVPLPTGPDVLLERIDAALAQREPVERLKAMPPQIARQIDELFDRMDTLSYYQLLDVPFESDRATIQGAFHQRSLLYHPDRHGRLKSEIPHAFEKVNTIYKRLSEAYRVLGNASQRHEYNVGLRRSGTLRYDVEARRRREEKNMELATTPDGRARVLKAYECRTFGDLEGAQKWLGEALRLEPQNLAIADQIDAIGKLLFIVQQANQV